MVFLTPVRVAERKNVTGKANLPVTDVLPRAFLTVLSARGKTSLSFLTVLSARGKTSLDFLTVLSARGKTSLDFLTVKNARGKTSITRKTD